MEKLIDPSDASKMIKITEEDPSTPEALLLMDELSEILASITGDSGRNSFDPNDVRVPRAVFAIAHNQADEAIGCGALRPINENIAEVKRMDARPKAMGVGSAILSFLETYAQKLGYSAIRLETRIINQRAVLFYESRGYHRIPNYGKYAGNPGAVCFEKLLMRV